MILVVLVAIAVPSVMKYIDDAKDAEVMAIAKGAVQETETTVIEVLGEREAKTWKDFETLVDKELVSRGYRKGMFGQVKSNIPTATDEWQVTFIEYEAVDKNGKVVRKLYPENLDAAIAYDNKPTLKKYQISVIKKINGKTSTKLYLYIPNQSFTLISEY